MAEFEYPTEVIDLPSKGWFYPEGHPLSSGQIDLYYMTAKHEDILTSRNLFVKGLALDRLMESLIATKGVKYNDLLIGDKNAIFVAARIMAYGKHYECSIICPQCNTETEHVVDLEELNEEPYDFEGKPRGKNEFQFTLPYSGKVITFKLLTHGDEKALNAEIQQLKKITGGIDPEVTTRMRYAILAVDGDTNRNNIHKFVDAMPVRDARAFREYARQQMPNIDFNINFECPECGHEGKMEVPIDISFFWPDA